MGSNKINIIYAIKCIEQMNLLYIIWVSLHHQQRSIFGELFPHLNLDKPSKETHLLLFCFIYCLFVYLFVLIYIFIYIYIYIERERERERDGVKLKG